MRAAMDANKAGGVQLVANAILNPAATRAAGAAADAAAAADEPGAAADLRARRADLRRAVLLLPRQRRARRAAAGAPAGTTGPSLAGSPRVSGHRDYMIKTLLHGLTGPLDGERSGMMIPMGSNPDQWVADVASYVRNSFGNSAPFVTAADVRARPRSTRRATPWTAAELESVMPAHPAVGHVVEDHGQPQSDGRGRCLDVPRLVNAGAAGTRHVVPGRASGGGVARRDPVPAAGGGVAVARPL